MGPYRWNQPTRIGGDATPQLRLERAVGLAAQRRASGGGEPKRLLVDFVVGAHALAHAERLLTLDPDRYRTAFLDLELVVGAEVASS